MARHEPQNDLILGDRRENRWRFDKTVSFGSILSVVMIMISLYTMMARISSMEAKVDIMWVIMQKQLMNSQR